MPIHVRDGGVWKDGVLYVMDGGIWKPVVQGLVKDAGQWKEFFNLGFDPITFYSNDSWTVPPGVFSIRIQAQSLAAVGGWHARTVTGMSVTRTVNTGRTPGSGVHWDWEDWITFQPLSTIIPFSTDPNPSYGHPGANYHATQGAIITYQVWSSSSVTLYYMDSNPNTLPYASTPASIPNLNTRTERWRKEPTFTIPDLTSLKADGFPSRYPLNYSNWLYSPMVWRVVGEYYRYITQNGSVVVRKNGSSSITSLSDGSTSTPNSMSRPPQSDGGYYDSIISVVPGDTIDITINNGTGKNNARYVKIMQV